MRALALSLILALPASGCTFAVKHPAATSAIVGGTIGLATCQVGTDFDEHGACALVGVGAAAFLGGVVLLAMLVGGEGNIVLNPPAEPGPELPTIEDPELPTIEDPDPAPTPAPIVPAPPAPSPAPDPTPTPPVSP